MLLRGGEKLLVAHRRLFEKDEVRFFIGRVDAYEAGVIKSTGHTFVRDAAGGRVVEKAEPRTKILSLASGTLLVYQLPDSVVLEELKFESLGGHVTLTDGKAFTMNLAEHTHGGRI
jgi:hypothetical protein